MEDINAAAEFLKDVLPEPPRIGMITGTGLGDVTGSISPELRIPFRDIPNFPKTTTRGHRGRLVYGTLGGVPSLALEGRFHLYEGYTPRQISLPVRVMARMGVTRLFISSAAGGLNPLFRPGDLMLVTDHINLTGANPLTGPNLDAIGPRFPDMTRAYDPGLLGTAAGEALSGGTDLKQGVYVGIPGPSMETPAETRFLRMTGADAVGMSTVIEVIAAVHCGLRVCAIVVITNVNLPDCMKETSIEEVVSRAEEAGPGLSRLWGRIAKAVADEACPCA
jgi:purine-nucleoside phosphorylase